MSDRVSPAGKTRAKSLRQRLNLPPRPASKVLRKSSTGKSTKSRLVKKKEVVVLQNKDLPTQQQYTELQDEFTPEQTFPTVSNTSTVYPPVSNQTAEQRTASVPLSNYREGIGDITTITQNNESSQDLTTSAMNNQLRFIGDASCRPKQVSIPSQPNSPHTLQNRPTQQLIDLGFVDTPYGRGVNHQFESYRSPVNLLTARPSKETLRECIVNLQGRIELFGKSFTDNIGWIGLYENKSARFENELDEIKGRCVENDHADLLAELVLLTTELDNHTERMRQYTLTNQVAQTLDRTEGQDHAGQLAPDAEALGGAAAPMVNNETADESASVLNDNDSLQGDPTWFPNRANLSRVRSSIKELKSKLLPLQEDLNTLQVNFSTLDKKVLDLGESKATQHDLLNLFRRTTSLEKDCADLMEYDRQCGRHETAIGNFIPRLEAAEAASRQYELLALGFGRDAVKLKRDLRRAEQKIEALEADPSQQNPRDRGTHIVHSQHASNQGTVVGILPISVPPITRLPSTNTRMTTATTVVMSTGSAGAYTSALNRAATGSTSHPDLSHINGINVRQSTGVEPIQNVELENRISRTTRTEYQDIISVIDSREVLNSTERSSDVGSDGSFTNTSNLSRLGKRLKRAAVALKIMLSPPVNNSLTKVVVQGVHKNVLPAVDAERKEISSMFDKYENHRTEDPNPELLNLVEDIIEDAREWAMGMRRKHTELDCGKKPLDKKFYEGLKPFGKESDLNIFEFLQRFESYMEEQGSEKEKASLLYEQYLSKTIQLETVDRKHDYNLLKRFLIHKFGDVQVITGNILRVLDGAVMPHNSSPVDTVTNYYRKLNSAIKRIQDLRKTVDMPLSELQLQVYSRDFLSKLINLVPEKCSHDFMDKLITAGMDPERIQGEESFTMLASLIQRYFVLSKGNESIRNDPKGNKKTNSPRTKRSAHTVQTPDDDDVQGVHLQQQEPRRQNQNASRGKPQTSEFRHPCTLEDHNHEIGECKQYFKASPSFRTKSAHRKSCFCCLGQKAKCLTGCRFLKAVEAAGLVCPECSTWALENNLPPKNILLCIKPEHTRPDDKALRAILSKYLKKFDDSKIQGTIKLAAHLRFVGHASNCTKCNRKKCKCQFASRTRKINPKEATPNINTSTGDLVKITKDQIIKESEHDSFYIMQTLKAGDRDLLTFFDRGANQHLIDGQLAEDLGLKVEEERPTNIGIVGGGTICTQYGTYSMTLGPTEDGSYHKIIAQGITSITSEFPRYNLTPICDEVRESNKLDHSTVLPEYIGGQRVSLLIGIKSPALDPEKLFQIPSGLAVFKSPLVDKFGSQHCFGGPHSLFTSVNSKLGNVNHINVYFTDMINQYKNSIYPALTSVLEPKLAERAGIYTETDCPSTDLIVMPNSAEVFPSAVNQNDLIDFGLSPVPMEDECICQPIGDPTPCIQGVHKAKIPISKRKEYFDEEDKGNSDGYRCKDCALCKKCLISDSKKMMSLQDVIEQEAIEKSVHVDLAKNKVFVDLPFIKPPVQALVKRHQGPDNYKQAHRIYLTQCRKSEQVKTEIRKVHADLVSRGFMIKLSELEPHQQEIIKTAEFRHYMPWRGTEKDSISTPLRLVVDASVTGLNEILAKGENKSSKINDIIIRNRCTRYVWSSDIAKMYNQLHLKDDALPFGLFLYHDELNPTIPPETYVMVVAWYGVSSTGNQGGEGLEQVTTLQREVYPLAEKVVHKDRYVDDLWSGSNILSEREDQIRQTKSSLANGGFNLKYVVRSGVDPGPEASSDGKALTILGYNWSTKEDIFKPGYKEINFNKKRRGSKKPNPFPVVTQNDVTQLLQSTKITRRLVLSKLAEIYDPVGLWEPYKLQLKLDSNCLSGLDWDVELEPELQEMWGDRFKEFLDIPQMDAPRCIIPIDAVDPNKIRLLCVSDAAESAGGCAIYAGLRKQDGTYSCQLLTARSKILHNSIPRNELEAVKLMAETAVNVKDTLQDKVEEILFFTDSTIAMCWCHNLNKKLRMFTLYRVTDVRRAIQLVTDTETLPLYHIDGKVNVADLVTKRHPITPKDVGAHSLWQTGYPWMHLPTSKISMTTYEDLTVTKDDESLIDLECFPEPILSKEKDPVTSAHLLHVGVLDSTHCTGCIGNDSSLPLTSCYGCLDSSDHCDICNCPIRFSAFSLKGGRVPLDLDIIKLGYLKTIRILTKLTKDTANFVHNFHLSRGTLVKNNCFKCNVTEKVGDVPFEYAKLLREKAKNLLFIRESDRIRSILPKKKLDSFVLQNGIYYTEGRLIEENPICQSDLDFDVFFDNTEIKSMLPVVLADSDLFFAYTMHIHNNVRPHAGVELTLREISKNMWVTNNPRRIIQRVRRDCTRCRLIAKRTAELRMANHPAARTHITPPFYHCQMDTVYGFKGQPYKNARKSFEIYALLIVCLLTGATSILAMEGLETQDVIQAIERHGSRHGIPAVVYVDNGAQLIALENVTFDLRNLQATVSDTHGMQVEVSTPKSHEARGRAEAKVKILRQMLEKLSVNKETCMTAIQWETLFSRISSQIDDIPIAKCNSSNVFDPGWDLITPNRLKLGRNNNRSLESPMNLIKGSGPTALLQRNREIQKFWYQMFIDRIHHLIPRPAKWKDTDIINIGDVCLFIHTENANMGSHGWKIGRIVSIPNKNKVVIEYASNILSGKHKLPKLTTVTRSQEAFLSYPL